MMRPISKALLASVWFMILTFPVMGIKLNTVDQTVDWQFDRIIMLGVAIFFLSLLWNWCFSRKGRGLPLVRLPQGLSDGLGSLLRLPLRDTKSRIISLGVLLAVLLVMPLVSSFYQTNIMILALLYVMLALGLNIAVGIAGQLVLGYVAFYAVGAYAYALLNQFFGLGFWACLPVGGLLAVLFGLALGFPVLRLRGDYLAIVTLGFGEIVRLTLLNWTSLTGGSGGIKNIPGPSFFGKTLDIAGNTIFIYYLVLLAVILTIVVITRLKNSRVGLALQALPDVFAIRHLAVAQLAGRILALATAAQQDAVRGHDAADRNARGRRKIVGQQGIDIGHVLLVLDAVGIEAQGFQHADVLGGHFHALPQGAEQQLGADLLRNQQGRDIVLYLRQQGR